VTAAASARLSCPDCRAAIAVGDAAAVAAAVTVWRLTARFRRPWSVKPGQKYLVDALGALGVGERGALVVGDDLLGDGLGGGAVGVGAFGADHIDRDGGQCDLAGGQDAALAVAHIEAVLGADCRDRLQHRVFAHAGDELCVKVRVISDIGADQDSIGVQVLKDACGDHRSVVAALGWGSVWCRSRLPAQHRTSNSNTSHPVSSVESGLAHLLAAALGR